MTWSVRNSLNDSSVSSSTSNSLLKLYFNNKIVPPKINNRIVLVRNQTVSRIFYPPLSLF